MSNKPEHTTYFREIIRKLKELESNSNKKEDTKLPLFDVMDEFPKLLELPFPPEMFEKLTSDEKETLFIWLNRNNIPQA